MFSGSGAYRWLTLSFFLFVLLFTQHSPVSSAENINALWIAESDGVLKVATADGTVLFEIANINKVKAVAVDEQRGRLWALAGNTLRAYTFDGVLQVTINVPVIGDDEGKDKDKEGDKDDDKDKDDEKDRDDDEDDIKGDLAISAEDGSVWLAVKKTFFRFDTDGALQTTITLKDKIDAIAFDEIKQRLWVATKKAVNAYDTDGVKVQTLDLGGKTKVKDIDVDQTNADIWVGQKKLLKRFSSDGILKFKTPLKKLEHIATADDGHVWVATKKRLLRVFKNGPALIEISPFNDKDKIVALVADPSDKSAWVARKKLIRQFNISGQQQSEVVVGSKVIDLALFADMIPPEISFTKPLEGSEVAGNNVVLDLEFSDEGAGVDTASLEILANGEVLAVNCTTTQTTANCTFAGTVPSGLTTFSATIDDLRGNTSNVAEVNVTIVNEPLAITLTSPLDGTRTKTPDVTFIGQLNRTATLTLNGDPVPLDTTNNFNFGPVTLQEGDNAFLLVSTDNTGDTAQLNIVVTLDTTGPVINLASPTNNSVTNVAEQTFIGSLDEPGTLTFNGAPVTVAPDNSFTYGPITLQAGANTFILDATDEAGNTTQLSVTITLDGVAPVITITSPANNTLTSQSPITVSGSLSEPALLTLNGQGVAVDAANQFSQSTTLAEGANTLTLIATDNAGNASQAVVSVVLDTTVPSPPNTGVITRSNPVNGNITVAGGAGSVEANATVVLTNVRTNQSITVVAAADGSFSGQIGGEASDTITIVASDAAGNMSTPVTLVPVLPANLTLNPVGDKIAPIGQTTRFTVTASNSTGAEITLGIAPAPLPEGANFNLTTGVFAFSPQTSQAGTIALTFTARTAAEFVTETITITVPTPDPAAPTRFTGRILDATNMDKGIITPVVNATVSFLNSSVSTQTDTQGNFTLVGVPAGDQIIDINSSKANPAPGGAPYASFRGKMVLIPNVNNIEERPFSMPRLAMASLTQVNPTATTVVKNDELGITLTVPAGMARNSDGSQFTGQLSISEVPGNLAPVALPEFLEPGMLVTIQPVGVVFAQPVPITFPNVDNLPPGGNVDIWSLDPDSGEFTVVGAGRVTSDGKNITTVSGGIRAADWHTPAPAPPDPVPSNNSNNPLTCPGTEKKIGSTVCLSTGRLGESVELPSYRSLQQSRTLKFVYQSSRARPVPTIPFDTTIRPGTLVPNQISYDLEVGGIEQGRETFIELEGVSAGDSARSSIAFEADEFTSGIYPYELKVTNNFTVTRIASIVTNDIIIVNEMNSAFGAGWLIDGLMNLVINDNGNALLIKPNGRHVVFRSGNTANEFITPVGDFSTLVRNADGSFTHTTRNGIKTNFDINGRQTSVVDRNSNTTVYGYDGAGQLIAVTDPVGRITTLTYTNGLLTSVTDPANRTSNFEHDTQGNLTKIIFPDNTSKVFNYDNRHLITSKANERQFTTTYTYDKGARLVNVELPDGTMRGAISKAAVGLVDLSTGAGFPENPAPMIRPENVKSTFVDGRGNVRTLELDTLSRPTRTIDETGRETLTVRDQDGNPTQTTRPNGSVITRTFDTEGNTLTRTEQFNGATTTFTYDPQFNLVTSITDPRNNTTTINRDPQGNPVESVNALGHITTLEYDTRGLLTRTVDPNGLVTTMVYDANGLPTTLTETPPGNTGPARITRNSYNSAGLLSQVITPDNVTVNLTYDARSRITTITDNLNQTVTLVYDEKGNVVKTNVNDPDGTLISTVSNIFDSRDRLLTSSQPHVNTSLSITARQYDNNDNLTGLTDPNSNQSVSEFDASNRLIKATDPVNGISQFDYDTNDRIVRVIAPNLAVTTFDYDVLGRQIKEISPDRGTLTKTYDLADNVTSITDARGITAGFAYDALNRVTALTYPNTQENITLTYDNCTAGVGLVCQVTDQSGVTDFTFDVFGNVITRQHTELGVTYTTAYTYDAGDNVIATTLPSGRTVQYTRDGVRRISGIQATLNGRLIPIVDTITYRADNAVTNRRFGNGLTDQRTYDQQSRLLTQTLNTADTRLYRYDANSNITARQATPQNSTAQYDGLDRLTTDAVDGNTAVLNYDANNNRLQRTQTGVFDERYFYTGRTNQLTGVESTSTGTSTPIPNRTLTYNNAGRLFQVVEQGTLTATYVYNANGLRTRKTTANGTTVYHYDLNGQLISETKDDGSSIRDYLWQDNTPVAQIDTVGTTDTIAYLHTDHLLTSRLATNSTGTVVWRWDGAAFGETLANEDIDGDGVLTQINLRFPGQYFDKETKLHYNWNRYYDPRVGRYITSDPIGLRGGLNTFGYVSNNPIMKFDLLGLIESCSTSNGIDMGCVLKANNDFKTCIKKAKIVDIPCRGLCQLFKVPGVGTGCGMACDLGLDLGIEFCRDSLQEDLLKCSN